MRNLSHIGRIFYGIAMTEMGLQTIYSQDFPYFMLPPIFPGGTGMVILTLIGGIILALAGISIVFKWKVRQVSLLFGGLLLLVFCYFVVYELLLSHNNTSPGDWENAGKGLSLAGGALAIASCFREEGRNSLTRFLAKLIPLGAILFAITIVYYGTLHFLYAKQAGDYIPAWIPSHLFWMYFCGAALLGSGLAIFLRILTRLAALGSDLAVILQNQTRLAATLLGAMILTWFIILHIPKVLAAGPADRAGELTSAFLALAYSGIAFVIAGFANRRYKGQS